MSTKTNKIYKNKEKKNNQNKTKIKGKKQGKENITWGLATGTSEQDRC